MRIAAVASASASAALLWERIAAVDRWPEWCGSVLVCEADGPLAPGTGMRMVLADIHPGVWTVVSVTPGRQCCWRAGGPGFVAAWQVGIETDDDGRRVRVSYRVRGPMAWAVMVIVRRPMRRAVTGLARALADGHRAGQTVR